MKEFKKISLCKKEKKKKKKKGKKGKQNAIVKKAAGGIQCCVTGGPTLHTFDRCY